MKRLKRGYLGRIVNFEIKKFNIILNVNGIKEHKML
jgi:hypothetical protein